MTPNEAHNLKVGDRVRWASDSPTRELGTVNWTNESERELGIMWDDGDEFAYDMDETRCGILHVEKL